MKKLPELYWIISAVLTAAGISVMTVGAVQMKSEAQQTHAEETFPVCQSVRIDVSGADLILQPAKDADISVSSDTYDEIEYTVKDDILYIHNKKQIAFQSMKFFHLGSVFEHRNQICVYLPEQQYQEVVITSGYGDMQISELNCDALAIDSGAGNVNLQSVTAEKYQCDMGAGNITAETCRFAETRIDSGAGNVEFEHVRLDGNAVFDCGAGEISLMIDGNSGNYAVDCSDCVGDVTVQNIQTKNLRSEKAEYQIKAETVGSVEISFTE